MIGMRNGKTTDGKEPTRFHYASPTTKYVNRRQRHKQILAREKWY